MAKIIRVITRLNVGGPAQHAILLTSSLRSRNFDCQLITGVVDPPEGDMMALARQLDVTPVVIPTLRNRIAPLGDFLSLVRLIRLFLRERPEIVHLHLFKARILGGIAARLTRVPIVVETFHGTLFSEYYGPGIRRLLIQVERVLARWMVAIVAVSQAIGGELARLKVAQQDKIHVVPLGLDLQKFRDQSKARGLLRQELGLASGVPVVGTVARLVPIKGLKFLVEAAANVTQAVPGVHFIIVGDGSERSQLQQQVEDHGLNGKVRFLGWRSDLAHIYPDFDVVVLSSLNEGTPVSLLEAMAAGRPVVATSVGGVPDLVLNGHTGVLVPPRDAGALAEAITALLKDPELRQRLGEMAQAAVVPAFSIDRLVGDMEAFYRRLLEQRTRRR